MLATVATSINDVHPWVVYLQSDPDSQFAFWQLADGRQALALFSTQQAANTYRDECLSEAWKSSRPSEIELARLLLGCYHNQIGLAVIDPTRESAKLLFSISEILLAVRSRLRELKN